MSKFNIIEQLNNLKEIAREISIRMRKLTFSDNFESFEVDLTISASSISTIRNRLTKTPTRYIIVSNDGDGVISKSSPWNQSYISFKNNGSVEATVKIIVME